MSSLVWSRSHSKTLFKVVWHKKTQSSHLYVFTVKVCPKSGLPTCVLLLILPQYHHATPTQSAQYSTVCSHPPLFSHSPFFSLSTELFMSLFAHAGQVLLPSLLRIPISQPPSPLFRIPQWSKQPPHCTDPSTKTHLCLANKTCSYIFFKTHTHTHTHTLSSLYRSVLDTVNVCFFPLCCCYELNKKAQCYWASLCGCEVWVEPQACWTIPFKSLFCRVS